ncbi:hypothetical protein Trydic_g14598 [Trypoxylus dichotomus]
MFRAAAVAIVFCVIVNTYGLKKCGEDEWYSSVEVNCDGEISYTKKQCLCNLELKYVRGPDNKCIPKSECEKSTTITITTTTQKPTTSKQDDDKKYCGDNEELQPLNSGSPGPRPYPPPPHYYRHYGYGSPSSCDDCKYKKCYVCKCKKGFSVKGGKCL